MQKLFTYAVLHHPKKKKDQDREPSSIIIEPRNILANDDKQAGIKIARELPEKYLDVLDEVEILVRPF